MVQATLSPSGQLFQIINGFWTSRAVYVAAKLGLADLVQEGPKTADELATVTDTHAPSLYRVLRALASVGIFVEDEHGRFASTPLGDILRSGVPGSLRSSAISELGEDHYDAWRDVLQSVKTGEIAFDHHFGMPVWQYYAQNPEVAKVFNESMSGLTRSIEDAVVRSCDFSNDRTVVDVGGGHGTFLAAILKANPTAKGVLFDVPRVVEAGQNGLRAEGLDGRIEAVGGDFFKAVPTGGDIYTLKWIIHDWDDAQSVAILKNCHRAMARGGRLLLVEAVIPPRNEPSFGKFMDLNMLVMTGGRERTAEEFRVLLAAAGFRLARVIATPSPVSVIEALREDD
ncbi:methyltransferase [Singulisphaera acidiphila]|uniref:Methylase involved in ubiquinone/menaquinone biosynthesis n=1 Tax=Singulisphaera acidiphila (strain ATCC BAA-1392 / DSM 18658 / VKM B-2454 / MOB10) TaxID=886293 RepID=L0DFX0_SINAD|nr:methyltransferase [Singulisphaera acidiphila]AGA27750.1 methylase involved in ubiquinone/menaquinone biosynthesis [Singulisphaera acidiphila DSM 18658]